MYCSFGMVFNKITRTYWVDYTFSIRSLSCAQFLNRWN
jgi:hypothetical protein